jgi:CDP-diacylglycerol--glycerol-3-phosphate 3-phosphatidyltransferase
MSRPSVPSLGRFWTIPNVLSLLRLALIAPITYLIAVDGSVAWLGGLIVVAAFSDWLDGRIARWFGLVSNWGKVLDPIADKVAAVTTVAALVFRPAEPNLPLWFLAAVVGRDVLIVLGGYVLTRRTGRIAMSQWWGKAAAFWLALTVLAAVLRADAPVLHACLYMTTGLLAVSFLVYLGRFTRALLRARKLDRSEHDAARAALAYADDPGDASNADASNADASSADAPAADETPAPDETPADAEPVASAPQGAPAPEDAPASGDMSASEDVPAPEEDAEPSRTAQPV